MKWVRHARKRSKKRAVKRIYKKVKKVKTLMARSVTKSRSRSTKSLLDGVSLFELIMPWKSDLFPLVNGAKTAGG